MAKNYIADKNTLDNVNTNVSSIKSTTSSMNTKVTSIQSAVNNIKIVRPGKQVFYSSGAFTVPSNVTEIYVTACAAGAGGTSIPNSIAIRGSNGGDTIIGSLITLSGGKASAGAAGGAGGGTMGGPGGRRAENGSSSVAAQGGMGFAGTISGGGGGASLGGGGSCKFSPGCAYGMLGIGGGGGNESLGIEGLYPTGLASDTTNAYSGSFGGGGAGYKAGGGGGGDFIIDKKFTVTPNQSIAITIGEGGEAGDKYCGRGGNGICIIEWY